MNERIKKNSITPENQITLNDPMNPQAGMVAMYLLHYYYSKKER